MADLYDLLCMHIVCTMPALATYRAPMPALATYRAPMPVHVYPVATLLSLVTYTSSHCM